MKHFIGFIVSAIILIVLISGCSQKPKPCPTCNGTGSITQSQQIPLPFQIAAFNVRNTGIINPDYFADVTVENQGDEDGTFNVSVGWVYKEIGAHVETGTVFVKTHSQSMTTIHYDPDHFADSTYCKVQPPMVVHSTKAICPTCGGSGLVK